MNPHQRGIGMPGGKPSTHDTEPMEGDLAASNNGDTAPITTGMALQENIQGLDPVGYGMRGIDTAIHPSMPLFLPPPPHASHAEPDREGARVRVLGDPATAPGLTSGPSAGFDTFITGNAGQGQARTLGDIRGKGRTARPSRRKHPYESRSDLLSRQGHQGSTLQFGVQGEAATRVVTTSSAPDLPFYTNPAEVPVTTDPALLYPGSQFLQPSPTFPFPGTSGGTGPPHVASLTPSPFGEVAHEGISHISTPSAWEKQESRQIPSQPYALPTLDNVSNAHVAMGYPGVFGDDPALPLGAHLAGGMPMYPGHMPPYGEMIDVSNATDITATMEVLSHSIQSQYPSMATYRRGRTTHQVGGMAALVSRSNRRSRRARESGEDVKQEDGESGGDGGGSNYVDDDNDDDEAAAEGGASAPGTASGHQHQQVKQWVQFDAEYWQENGHDGNGKAGSGRKRQGWTWHHA